MTTRALRVLLIEDNPGDARLIQEMLAAGSRGHFQLVHVDGLTDGIQCLSEGDFAVVLLDLSLGESSGIDTFRKLHENAPETPVVVLTGSDDDALAARALQAGAQDYLVKGQVNHDLLARSLRYAVERDRIEEQLRRRARELTEASRRKDEFLAILSHELRNPLSPLKAAVQLLRRSNLAGAERDWAHLVIERQVNTMTRLINDLLDVSRISRGKIALRKEAMDLRGAIQRAVESTRSLFTDNRVELQVLLPAAPLMVDGDLVRLEQVMVNLLSNAAKYTPQGGQAWLTADGDQTVALVRVRDTGVGIPPDMLENVFELFTQVDTAMDRRSQFGMGVGLALVRSFVELHGGSIKALSQGAGAGTEFVIRLPLLGGEPGEAASSAAVEPNTEPYASAAPCNIILAEDHPDSAMCISRLLRFQQHEVRVVDNGLAVLQAAREFHPDLIVLDIGLPGADGYEVARSIRREPLLHEIPLVALTGYGREEDRERAAAAGFNAHLTKPIDPDALLELVERLCRPQPAEAP